MRQLNKAALAFEQTKRHCYLGAPMLAMTLSDTYYRDRNVADNPIVRGLVTKKYWPRAPRVPAGIPPVIPSSSKILRTNSPKDQRSDSIVIEPFQIEKPSIS